MTSETKQRIEQIRNGKVPEGYKKTKYGVFPSHWKVDKLGNYLQELRELTNEIEKYPVYSSSRKGLLPQSQYYDKREAVTTNLGYKKVPNGYVTYRHMSDDDIFRFNKNTTEDTVLVSSEYPVFNCNTNGNIDYILPLLNDSPRFKYYCRIQKMGGTRTRLYYKNLCQYTTAFPPLKEQQKIANILSAQDTVIECYEKKIEQLKRMKKYYLQNMFPKRGETVPKIRFKGFADTWEQRKVREISDRYDNLRIPVAANLRIQGTTPYYGANGIQDYVEGFTHDGEFVLVAEDGANDLKNYPVKCVNGRIWVNNHAHVLQGKSKITANLFLAFSISQADIESLLVGGGRAKLNAEVLMDIELSMPSFEEQHKIGSYLAQFENLITLHQRLRDEEKKKKKALQQLLLTGIVRVNHG
ncbi:restriction endonuclease subunit S [Ruminococcus sp.]|uniref:restriction endonuclease subunit S n=1 Tax=Ruminococcus sp. TaxID=41978 RepID=UPI00388FDE0B